MKGDKIYLGAIQKEDICFINQLRNDWDNKKMTLGIRFPISLEDDSNWFSKTSNDHTNKNAYFSIRNYLDKFVGMIQLSSIDWINRTAYLGYQIIREEFGNGYATESIKLMLDYSYNVLNLNKILVEIASYNIVSLHIAEKIGFKIEGQLKNQIFYDDSYHDCIILSKFR